MYVFKLQVDAGETAQLAFNVYQMLAMFFS